MNRDVVGRVLLDAPFRRSRRTGPTTGDAMRRLLARLLNVFRSERADSELMREIAAHLALLEDDYRRRGMTPDEARLAARRAMGSVAYANDLHRDARAFTWIDDLVRPPLPRLRRTTVARRAEAGRTRLVRPVRKDRHRNSIPNFQLPTSNHSQFPTPN